jgi:hypothetical protein
MASGRSLLAPILCSFLLSTPLGTLSLVCVGLCSGRGLKGESLLGGGRFDGQRALKCRRCANLCIPPLVWGGVPSPQTLASEHDGAHRLL